MATGFKSGNPGCACCGPPTHTITGCPCTNIPDTITMNVTRNPTNGTEYYLYNGATLTWGPKPADLAAYLTASPGYYSAAKYTSSPTGMNTYRYFLTCSSGQYSINALMTPDSAFGFPGLANFGVWTVGINGNTCFNLRNGGGSGGGEFTFDGVGIS